MEAADFSETPIHIDQTTRCHVPDVSNLQGSAVKTLSLTDHIQVALVLRLLYAPCQYIPLLKLRSRHFRLNAVWRNAALYYV
jgi:hypothetical protein